jgi:hypothetical protein
MPPSRQCLLCKHSYPGGLACFAFPHGIPRDILAGTFDHSQPHRGDRSIRFESLAPSTRRDKP